MMASSHEPSRLRQGLNPLTTTLGGYNNNQLTTPMSALSMSSGHMSVAQTPASAIQPYNPQEWGHAPPVAERTPQFGEPQGSPLPPPPYSPPRSQHSITNSFDHSLNNTPTPPPRMIQNVMRPSPEPQAVNPSFAPPPGSSARGASRERRFGLPFRSRGTTERNSSSPDLRPPMPQARQSMVIPSTFHLPTADQASRGLQYGPPAARRAASAGAIETPTSGRSRAPSQSRWEPGMPIPPPPPGPPPPQSRSQSVQPMDRSNVPILSPPTRRPPPSTGGTALGPVPPTPADWVDSDHPPPQPQPARGRSPGLIVDTEAANNAVEPPDTLGSASSSAGLNRARAVRRDKTIIQRRSESRNRDGARQSMDGRAQPRAIADIVVPKSANLARRLALGKTTPRSGQLLDTPGTGDTITLDLDSRNSTPRAVPSAKLPKLDTGTPPFSPNPSKQPQHDGQPSTIAPKALPTPPPHTRSSSKSRARDSSRPPPSASAPVSKHQIVTQTAEQFATGTIERFQAFAAKEVAADTDADRVRLFADFIVNESRIRRERYSTAIGAMGSETFDLTRDLFRPMVPSASRRDSSTSRGEWTPSSTDPVRPRQGSFSSNYGGEGTQSAPGSAGIAESPGSAPANPNYSNNFMPSLSPILSMGASDNYENGSSRGRPPSRWWEVDSQGEPSNMERHSKRESKHMAVSKNQWVEDEPSHAGPSDQSMYMEYPPEKTGWHDQDNILTPQPPNLSTTSLSSTVGSTPTSVAYRDQLDVSRLVTLPPPYPRHHPAVNNNHPELTSIRTSVRVVSEISEVKTTKEAFEAATKKRREEFAKAAAERKQTLRATLQQEINSGNIGYAEAGVIEQDTQQEEVAKRKDLEKSEYERFQNEVVLPLNDLLTERISRATDLFDDLARSLFDDGRIDADIPQEEGDDRPELLEKLTLLKWIFEARETLHRAIYDLLTDRNSRYCEVILTPYRLTNNTEKLKSAGAFFAEDASKREYAFANEVLNRTRDFRTVIEEAVTHGVALQLSAFWDIAPPLCELLDKVPSDLEGFTVQIPAAEFEENPSYHEHPMQYLFSLLLHAEKSTYQFIESHTNLLCLLHEVKEAVANAKGRVLETQTEEPDGKPISEAERQQRAQQMRQAEEHRLTQDLKEKARVVGDQWNDALGEDIKLVKERLGEWLLSTGGWDEQLEDGGVGAS